MVVASHESLDRSIMPWAMWLVWFDKVLQGTTATVSFCRIRQQVLM